MEINMQTNNSFGTNNVVIEKVNSIKYLGFIVDNNLKLKKHLEYKCRNTGNNIGFFKWLRIKVSMLTSINICNTMLKPHFEYGLAVL